MSAPGPYHEARGAGLDHPQQECRRRPHYVRALTRRVVARLFGVDESRVTDFVVFEPAHAIKFTIRRMRPSGSMGESDLFGAQQYAPLFDIEIP